MLVSAVSMNGVIPAVKNSKQSHPNYASIAQTHDTFQKSGVSFGVGGSSKKSKEIRRIIDKHWRPDGSARSIEEIRAINAKERTGRKPSVASSSSSDSSSSSSNSKYGDEPFYWSVVEDHCP